MGAPRTQVSASPHPRTLLSIGQVLQRLTAEFPDLSPSKLRFLEDRGLIMPGRTPAGYRTYTTDDVERLRTILGLQRDHYLPLKVIKQYLADNDKGIVSSPPTVSSSPAPAVIGRVGRVDRSELLARTGASDALLEEAMQSGLIRPGSLFDQHDERVLGALVHTGSFGITPRHLRGLVQASEREADLIRRAIGQQTSTGSAKSRRSREEWAGELADHISHIRLALVREALERLESA